MAKTVNDKYSKLVESDENHDRYETSFLVEIMTRVSENGACVSIREDLYNYHRCTITTNTEFGRTQSASIIIYSKVKSDRQEAARSLGLLKEDKDLERLARELINPVC
ncbi:hypothetical protein J4216_04140 [Candidatus Woesearchaeota archaeon]|nr:hypothetical protein [Candidatus Woesearchaeota archaeon]